jgi:hypothetical protein
MLDAADFTASLLHGPTVAVSALVALAVLAFAPRRLRALVIFIAQYTGFFAVVFAAAIAGRHGYGVGGAIGAAQGLNELGRFYAAVAGAAAGGLVGLAIAAPVLAVFFVLLEIRDNTKG